MHKIIIILSVIFLTACNQYVKEGQARTWKVPSDEMGFPEQELLSIGSTNKKTFSIAFSGGGTRAATATYGQLRMLNQLGWLDKAQYISSVSGGTWGSLPYTYLPLTYLKVRAESICKRQSKLSRFVLPKLHYVNCVPQYERKGYRNKCVEGELKLLRKYYALKCERGEYKNECEKAVPLEWNNMPSEFVDALYFGAFIPPEKITRNEDIEGFKPSDRMGKVIKAFNDTDALQTLMFDYSASAIVGDNSHVLGDYLMAILSFKWDEMYAEILGSVFLDDVGLFNPKKRDKRYFSHISTKYDDRGLPNDKFYFTRADRPFHIANTSMMSGDSKYKNYIYYQMTPLYVGPLGAHHVVDKRGEKRDLSYLLENWAFDAKRPSGGSYRLVPEKKTNIKSALLGAITFNAPIGAPKAPRSLFYNTPFSLTDVMAASGAAPAHSSMVGAKLGFLASGYLIGTGSAWWGVGVAGISYLLHGNFGFPEFRYPYQGADTVDGEQTNISVGAAAFGDGGHMENFGLMPLLARQEQKILVFVNTATEFSHSPLSGKVTIDKNLTSLFRFPDYYEMQDSRIKNNFVKRIVSLSGGVVGAVAKNLTVNTQEEKVFLRYPNNGVFKADQFSVLVDAFSSKVNNDKPLVHCQSYDVQANKHYGVTAYEADICWVYLQVSRKWHREIGSSAGSNNYDGVNNLRWRTNGFSNFPNYKTFVDNADDLRLGVIKKSRAQAQALSQYTSWVLHESSGQIGDFFGVMGADRY